MTSRFFQHHCAGHTLIELIVVVMIVGIIATAASNMIGLALFRRADSFVVEGNERENRRALFEIEFALKTAMGFDITDSIANPAAMVGQGNRVIFYNYVDIYPAPSPSSGLPTRELWVNQFDFTATNITPTTLEGALSITRYALSGTAPAPYVYSSTVTVPIDSGGNRPFRVMSDGSIQILWISPVGSIAHTYTTQTYFRR